MRRAVAVLVGLASLAGGAPPAAEGVLVHGLRFPDDYGSHPQFRTEWWYVTGWLSTPGAGSLGFQVTFFRSRLSEAGDNPSAFAPRQLIIAHAAISDPERGRLYQDQRIERAGLSLADASVGDTHVWVDRWSLQRGAEAYETSIAGEDFSLSLRLAAPQAPMLNGQAGLSRKGAAEQATSRYYSIPHLQASGTIERAGRREPVHGEAWLDHEWSNEYLEPEAVGWDWIGINLDDGGALMAFQIRGADGTTRWAGATLRRADGTTQAYAPGEVGFTPIHEWTSPRTAIRYPVQWRVRVGSRELLLQPLMDDQENDTRLSSGTIYWEGAVRAFDASRTIGRGYLELTGYGERLQLR
ncbi:MAG: lipocalin-like domain-containing protein [Steroidobacterales bacterium]